MLLDNVTTVLLMAPITITLCEDLGMKIIQIIQKFSRFNPCVVKNQYEFSRLNAKYLLYLRINFILIIGKVKKKTQIQQVVFVII